MAQYREYPVPIVLHRMKESHFSVLQDIMKDNPAKSYLVLQCDTLSSIGVNALLAQH